MSFITIEVVLPILKEELVVAGFPEPDIEEICSSFELLNTAGAFKMTSSRLDLVSSRRVNAVLEKALSRALSNTL